SSCARAGTSASTSRPAWRRWSACSAPSRQRRRERRNDAALGATQARAAPAGNGGESAVPAHGRGPAAPGRRGGQARGAAGVAAPLCRGPRPAAAGAELAPAGLPALPRAARRGDPGPGTPRRGRPAAARLAAAALARDAPSLGIAGAGRRRLRGRGEPGAREGRAAGGGRSPARAAAFRGAVLRLRSPPCLRRVARFLLNADEIVMTTGEKDLLHAATAAVFPPGLARGRGASPAGRGRACRCHGL